MGVLLSGDPLRKPKWLVRNNQTPETAPRLIQMKQGKTYDVYIRIYQFLIKITTFLKKLIPKMKAKHVKGDTP